MEIRFNLISNFFFVYNNTMINKLKNLLPYLITIFFIIAVIAGITDCGLIIKRVDVAHAWTIAGNCNLLQLIDLMKHEGHFLLWYLCLAPFAKLNLFYPVVMHALNIIFCTLFVYLLWKKAPFNLLIKLLITFSSFTLFYAINPRCYGLSIMFLAFSCVYYKSRLEHPYKYLLTLILLANTSVPACISAGYLGILFLYDLYKNSNKKALFITILVALLNLVLFYFQFHGVQTPDYEKQSLIKAPYYLAAYLGLEQMLPIDVLLKMIFFWIVSILFPFMLFKSKRAFVFFVATSVTCIMFFTYVYEARPHHLIMLYFIAIAAFWMHRSETSIDKNYDWRSIVFSLILLPFLLINVKYEPEGLNYLADFISNDKELYSAKLFTNFYPLMLANNLPYINKYGQKIYDLKGRDLSSYEGLKAYLDKDEKSVKVEEFAKNLDNKRKNFILLNGRFSGNYMKSGDIDIKFKLYKVFIPKDSSKRNSLNKVYVYEVLD